MNNNREEFCLQESNLLPYYVIHHALIGDAFTRRGHIMLGISNAKSSILYARDRTVSE